MFAEDGEADADDGQGDEGERNHVGAEVVAVADVVGDATERGGQGGGGVVGEEGVEDGEEGEEFDGGPKLVAAGAVGPGSQVSRFGANMRKRRMRKVIQRMRWGDRSRYWGGGVRNETTQGTSHHWRFQ